MRSSRIRNAAGAAASGVVYALHLFPGEPQQRTVATRHLVAAIGHVVADEGAAEAVTALVRVGAVDQATVEEEHISRPHIRRDGPHPLRYIDMIDGEEE